MMTCEIIVSCRPPSSAGVMKKPSALMNTRRPAEATPGTDMRKKICQKALPPRAPRVRAALTRVWSRRCITDSIAITASGIIACTMPIIVPVKLKISDSGASVMPSASSSLFTAPLRPSRIIHEKVRTRKLVQNGIRTRMVRTSRVRGRAVARRYATG